MWATSREWKAPSWTGNWTSACCRWSAPLSADAGGTLLNINADTVAAAFAVALSAEKLILIGGRPGGLLADPDDPERPDLLPRPRPPGASEDGRRAPGRDASQGRLHPQRARRRGGAHPPAGGRCAGQPSSRGLHPRGLGERSSSPTWGASLRRNAGCDPAPERAERRERRPGPHARRGPDTSDLGGPAASPPFAALPGDAPRGAPKHGRVIPKPKRRSR